MNPSVFMSANVNFDSNVLGDRHVDARLQVAAAERARAHLNAPAELIAGSARHILDGAAERRVAEQRALWTAQHFDPFDFDDAHREQPDGARLVDAVDVDGDAGHAAHAERGFRLVACGPACPCTDKFGAIAFMLPTMSTPRASRDSPVNAVIASGTVCRLSSRRRALTMISSSPASAPGCCASIGDANGASSAAATAPATPVFFMVVT